MTAKDILSPIQHGQTHSDVRHIDSDMPLLEVLPRLLDSPGRMLGVTESDRVLGYIDESSMLEGLGRMIAPRDDCSEVMLECTPSDYSASLIARAVEDADVHLVDLWTAPGPDDTLNVSLRVRVSDPSSVVQSLERYGYNVMEAHGAENMDMSVMAERLLGLRMFLNV